MKIVMLNTHDTVGGAAIACKRLIESLKLVDDTLEITLLVNEKGGNEGYVKKAGSKINLYLEKLLFFFSEKSKKTRFSFSTNTFGSNISRNKHIKEADIIHFHWINQGFLSLADIQRLLDLNKPIFWTFHDMWPMTGGCHHSRSCNNYKEYCGECYQYLRKPSKKDLSNQILLHKLAWRGLDKVNVISISPWMDEKIDHSKLFESNPVYQIANPIDTSVFKPSSGTSERKSLYEILVVAAKIDNDFKGFELLVKIAESLSQIHPRKFCLKLVGSISQDSLDRLSLPYTILGMINSDDEMADIYRDSDLLLSSSPDESFSYTCLEALSCGTPIIAYDTGAIAEFVKQFGMGFLVNDYTTAAYLSEFECFLKSDIQKVSTYRENPYSYNNVGQQMIKAYQES